MEQTVARMRMVALVHRRAHHKKRKLMIVQRIVSAGGKDKPSSALESRPCSTDSSCGNCCNFVEFTSKLLSGQNMSSKDQSLLYEPIKELDITLNQVCKSCRNPHSFDVDDIRFLGTYGKNINDLDKYSEAKSKLDLPKED
ncbi:hypothetical protein Rs2_08794 [Raphanus sativus]|nr:hypothetical protein Rs2_08794 [Raphanus sativus]